MKIVIFGSGGVGGYFGARLADAGEEVVFVARGDHLEAINRNGLKVESPLGDLHLPDAIATDDVAAIGPADIVILTVKLWSTADALEQMKTMVGPRTCVLSLQNGVGAGRVIAETLGEDTPIGGLAYISSHIERPGVIRHIGTNAHLTFGELDGRVTKRVEDMSGLFDRAGIAATQSEAITLKIWEKFVFLSALSGLCALTREPVGKIIWGSQSRQVLQSLLQEACAVGRSTGIPLSPEFVEQQLAFCEKLPEQMEPSMLFDLRHGHRLELDWLTGDVVRMADEHGVDVPASRAVCCGLARYRDGS